VVGLALWIIGLQEIIKNIIARGALVRQVRRSKLDLLQKFYPLNENPFKSNIFL
jgi:hypothetical protein